MKTKAILVTFECNCGGLFIDPDTYSSNISADTKIAVCEDCAKEVPAAKFPKTARLFA